MVLQCLETRPRVHTFTSASSLNNTDIVESYVNPSRATKSSLQSHKQRRANEEIIVGHETTSKLSFPINLMSYPYKCHEQPQSSYKNNTLRYISTKTLMSPRYSNVTTSTHGLDYTICITQFQIHHVQSNTKNFKECPKVSTGESRRKRVPNATSRACVGFPLKRKG